MRRNLFLLSLLCVSLVAADARAQQFYSQPFLGNSSTASGCCSQNGCASLPQGMPVSGFSGSPISYSTNGYGQSVFPTSGTTIGQPVTSVTNIVPSGTPLPLASSNIAYPNTNYVQTYPASTVSSYPAVSTYPTNVVQSYPANVAVQSPVAPSVTYANYSPSTFSSANYVTPNVTQGYTQTSMPTASNYSSSGLAQQKAQMAAQMRLQGHVGGGLGGAKYEGVGWSNMSPQSAVQNCCYWGQRPASQIGVARGADGSWYACVLYR